MIACSSTTRFSKSRASTKSNVASNRNQHTPEKQSGQGTLWQNATAWLGVPYRYGGTNRSGIDCSALAGHIYRDVYGINLPRTVADMIKKGRSVNGQKFKEGDLLFFKNTRTGPVDHVGIYLGEGRFIHASTTSGVIISDSGSGLYRRRLITARRYVR
jgi:lipoprotein Spr